MRKRIARVDRARIQGLQKLRVWLLPSAQKLGYRKQWVIYNKKETYDQISVNYASGSRADGAVSWCGSDEVQSLTEDDIHVCGLKSLQNWRHADFVSHWLF
jgi:hypothetical protein